MGEIITNTHVKASLSTQTSNLDVLDSLWPAVKGIIIPRLHFIEILFLEDSMLLFFLLCAVFHILVCSAAPESTFTDSNFQGRSLRYRQTGNSVCKGSKGIAGYFDIGQLIEDYTVNDHR